MSPNERKVEVSREAKRLAAVLLDVLAGSRTTLQAAQTLGLSLPRYYQLEDRAMAHFLAGCESQPRGRQVSVGAPLQTLTKENERLKRELARFQSLARLTQRTVGVPPPTPAKDTGKRRKRKPMVRALRRAERYREESEGDTGAEIPASPGTE